MRIKLISLLAIWATHAGAQWAPQQSGTTAEFRGLVALSANVVWASGTRGRLGPTTDGGKSWHIDSIAGADSLDLRDIHALSATQAWAMSAGPAERGQAKIFRTQDSASWTNQFHTNQQG